MNLESIAKYFAPKSPMLSDSPRATASDGLTGTDIMAALGLVNAKCGFGFDLYLAKIGVSTPDRAMELLYESAERLSIRFNIVSELSQDVRKEFSKFCVLLHTRITREVLPALENALAAMGLASQRPRCSPINAHIRGASHLFGQRCPERFDQATGRAGAKCVRWSKLNAQPVTERVLSAIRVAAMGKEKYWIKRPVSALGYR